jgi:hypothetical protein
MKRATYFRCRVSIAAIMVAVFAMPFAAKAEDALPRKQTQLFELARHLYRWYLDEEDIGKLRNLEDFTFWVRELKPALDEGDRSRFAEVTLPQLDIVVNAKKADYDIEELGLTIASETFKITNVSRGQVPPEPHEGSEVITVKFAEMLDYLFRTRAEAAFPEGDLLERLRRTVRLELAGLVDVPKGVQVVHLSPLSPVANELWVYWESGRMLLHFACDIDLANPAVWDHEDMVVKTYDIDRQVVVSFDEAPGSNAYLSRDQVGRILYNCMVLGRRVELTPPEAAATP